jgi:hypothetical protein
MSSLFFIFVAFVSFCSRQWLVLFKPQKTRNAAKGKGSLSRVLAFFAVQKSMVFSSVKIGGWIYWFVFQPLIFTNNLNTNGRWLITVYHGSPRENAIRLYECRNHEKRRSEHEATKWPEGRPAGRFARSGRFPSPRGEGERGVRRSQGSDLPHAWNGRNL